jgi:hypothetical protein
MAGVLPTLSIALTGSSLTTGRLAAPKQGFRAQLLHDMADQPEAKGQIVIYDEGHGGWTSLDILNNAPRISGLKPTIILAEGGAINDCFDSGGGPAISRAQHNINNTAMINEWKTNTPNSLIFIQTMSSVDATVATARVQLPNYYADEIATATSNGVGYLDHYPAWPAPLSTILTDSGDGLHPLWTGAFDTYSYPSILAWARAQMAAFWP